MTTISLSHLEHATEKLVELANLLQEAEEVLSDIADDDGSIADLRKRINAALARARGEQS